MVIGQMLTNYSLLHVNYILVTCCYLLLVKWSPLLECVPQHGGKDVDTMSLIRIFLNS